MDTIRTAGEIAFGLLFLTGAIFHMVYTRNHGEEFFGSFAEGAWLPPARTLMNQVVIPNSVLFALLLTVIQGAIALLILSRTEFVVVGLVAGIMFSLVGAIVSSPGGTAGNLMLAVLQGILLMIR